MSVWPSYGDVCVTEICDEPENRRDWVGVWHMQTADWQIIYRVYTINITEQSNRSAILANWSSSLANPSASLHLSHTGTESGWFTWKPICLQLFFPDWKSFHLRLKVGSKWATEYINLLTLKQSTKKFRSDSPGPEDFVVGLLEFILHLPDGQVKAFGEIFL